MTSESDSAPFINLGFTSWIEARCLVSTMSAATKTLNQDNPPFSSGSNIYNFI